MHNKLLFRMGISETPNCLFCKTETVTIEHICIGYDDVKNLWKATEEWVRMIHDANFKISDIAKIFGENNNSPVKQLIISSVKGVIYSKRKTGKRMTQSDLKKWCRKESKHKIT